MSTLPKDIANGITATRKQNMDWLKLEKAGMWCVGKEKRFCHLQILKVAQWFVNRQKESIEAAFLEQAGPLWIRECSHLGRVLLTS